MKYVKTMLYILISAIYTSSWWAAAVFAMPHPSNLEGLWAIPIVMSVLILVVFIFWLIENWNKN